MIDRFNHDGKYYFVAMAGSAADTPLAAEFSGRFYTDREPLDGGVVCKYVISYGGSQQLQLINCMPAS